MVHLQPLFADKLDELSRHANYSADCCHALLVLPPRLAHPPPLARTVRCRTQVHPATVHGRGHQAEFQLIWKGMTPRAATHLHKSI